MRQLRALQPSPSAYLGTGQGLGECRCIGDAYPLYLTATGPWPLTFGSKCHISPEFAFWEWGDWSVAPPPQGDLWPFLPFCPLIDLYIKFLLFLHILSSGEFHGLSLDQFTFYFDLHLWPLVLNFTEFAFWEWLLTFLGLRPLIRIWYLATIWHLVCLSHHWRVSASFRNKNGRHWWMCVFDVLFIVV